MKNRIPSWCSCCRLYCFPDLSIYQLRADTTKSTLLPFQRRSYPNAYDCEAPSISVPTAGTVPSIEPFTTFFSISTFSVVCGLSPTPLSPSHFLGSKHRPQWILDDASSLESITCMEGLQISASIGKRRAPYHMDSTVPRSAFKVQVRAEMCFHGKLHLFGKRMLLDLMKVVAMASTPCPSCSLPISR